MKKFNRSSNLLVLIVICMGVASSCSDYLTIKPDKRLATPTSPKELQAILDMVGNINNSNVGLGEVACDNFFLSYENWQAIPTNEDREIYTWEKVPVNSVYWLLMYQKVYYANTVIDFVGQVEFDHENERSDLYGQAMFVRGMAFHKLAEVFTVPYDPHTASSKLGIVLRTSSDINIKPRRSNLEETYRQIIHDLEAAVQHLDTGIPEYPTRPSRAAAYGALARCYLSMRAYQKAGAYADSCLALQADLLDYNDYTGGQPYPFEQYNEEVIYHSWLNAPRHLREAVARVDTMLYDSYATEDLRKTRFFSQMDDGYHAFTGDYARSSSSKFDGITTAEMWLVRAECLARSGEYDGAKAALLELLSNRFPATEDLNNGLPLTAEELVNRLIEERRKELIGRGLRWSDIRRLSFEEERSIDLVRNHGGEFYNLDAQQQKEFAFHLPESAIALGKILQND